MKEKDKRRTIKQNGAFKIFKKLNSIGFNLKESMMREEIFESVRYILRWNNGTISQEGNDYFSKDWNTSERMRNYSNDCRYDNLIPLRGWDPIPLLCFENVQGNSEISPFPQTSSVPV